MVYAEAARRRGDDIRLMASIRDHRVVQQRAGQSTLSTTIQSALSKSGGFHWDRFEFSFAIGHAAACGSVSCKFGFPAGDRGDRAVMITDTAFYRYRHYHQPSDTPDKIAYPELARVTAGLFAPFLELARGGVDRRARRNHG
jgi:hypothetical protein